MPTRPRMRLVLADDHNLFRKGLVSMLSANKDWQVVGEADNGQQAIDIVREIVPDLVLMDVHMPICDGIQAVRVIKRELPQVKIIMLSASDEDQDLFASIKSGADGYLLKNLDPAQLFDYLEGVRRGEAAINGILADRLLREFRKAGQERKSPTGEQEALTPAEIETLQLLAGGASNKEIAEMQHVAENTVKLHLRNIMDKLHLQNRVQLAVYAVRQRLVDDPPATQS